MTDINSIRRQTIAADFRRDGFCLVRGVVDESLIRRLTKALAEPEQLADSIRVRGGATYGQRNLLALVPAAREFAASALLTDIVAAVIGLQARPTKGISFDKTPEANWGVPWHQDLTIVVKEQREVPGFAQWSVKGGRPNVQPPVEVMAQIVAVRVHLDPCPAENGALHVLPGTHLMGRLDVPAIERCRREIPEHVCVAERGDVLLMSPILLHASFPSRQPVHRRVMHFEYSAIDLPGGLEWDV